jgi:ferritin-like metal-binding protein YciE
VILNISIKKFEQQSLDCAFDEMICENCENLSEFTRIFNMSSSKIKRDNEEIMRQIKEDSRKIVRSIQSGNTKTMRDIYGEE